MRLPLAFYPHPVLLKKTERVNHIDDALRHLVYDMVETMHVNDGIGLAAPQIFHSLSLFVSCVPRKRADGRWYAGKNRVFINPKLIKQSDETAPSPEGCLSIPNIPVTIQRPTSILIQATDLTGQTFEETLTGLDSFNFLHETDHLNGILIIDYLSNDEREKIAEQLEEIKKNFPPAP